MKNNILLSSKLNKDVHRNKHGLHCGRGPWYGKQNMLPLCILIVHPHSSHCCAHSQFSCALTVFVVHRYSSHCAPHSSHCAPPQFSLCTPQFSLCTLTVLIVCLLSVPVSACETKVALECSSECLGDKQLLLSVPVSACETKVALESSN